MHELIRDITLCILFAWVLGLLAHFSRQPLILAYLIAGFFIGPFGMGWVKSQDSITVISELGLIFMLFMIGLELSVERLWALRRLVFGLGTLQVVIPAAVIGAIAWGFGNSPQASIIFGSCLAITLFAALTVALGLFGGRLVAAGLVAGLSAIVVARDSRVLMTLACAAIITMGAMIQHQGVMFADRSFYGAVRVMDTDDGQWRRFAHGTTLHGVQSLDPARAHTPTGYYGPLTPIGSAAVTFGLFALVALIVALVFLKGD